MEPYQLDNSRLTQENISLHQQIMQLKESLEHKTKELKAAMRRVEHENTDLKFLNNQYMHRLLTQEKESQAKSERIITLQEKSSQAVVQTPGGRKKQIPFRRQRMEIDSALPPPPPSSSDPSSKRFCAVAPPPDQGVVDLLKVADQRIEKLQLSLVKAESDKKQLQESTQELKKQVN